MKNNKRFLAFLGDSKVSFIWAVIAMVGVQVMANWLNYEYLLVQKKVQEGNLEYWHKYLVLGLVTILMAILVHEAYVFITLWLERVLKFNAFDRYDGIVQQEGKLKLFLNKFEYEHVKVYSVIEIITTVIGIVYAFVIMNVVKFTVPQFIGGILIFLLGIGFGVVRGILQQKADGIRSEIGARQQLLSTHFMPGKQILKFNLKIINRRYWKNLVIQVIKNFFQKLPELIKIICFLAFMWEITNNFIVGEEVSVYSYSYIIWTAYGQIVSVANDFGNIVESITRIVRFRKDKNIKLLDEYELSREQDIERERKNVRIDKYEGFTITNSFTAKIVKKDKRIAQYRIPNNLQISKGEMVLLEGDNGLGKTRLSLLVSDIIPNTLWYNPLCQISDNFMENFRAYKVVDYELIMRLANGLGLERVPMTPEAMEALDFDEPLNGADRQLLILLQILYYAIKDSEKLESQLVILDEVLANVSPENAPKVIAFVKDELNKIGACTIFITHAHKSCVYNYIDDIWQMSDEGKYIEIKKKT